MSEEASIISGYLEGIGQRWQSEDVIAAIKDMRSLKVVVIGDIIIDEYHYCKAVGKASKSATLTARFLSEERQAGGALAVANHLAGFVDQVHLVTYLGQPSSEEGFVRAKLRPAVQPHLVPDFDRPVVVKRRYVDPFQLNKMFEVMWIGGEDGPSKSEEALIDCLSNTVDDCDLVVVADFGHGAVSPSIIDWLVENAPFLSVTAQTNSANFGYNVITKYPRGDYICIDEEELRLSNHDRYGDLGTLLDRTARALGCRFATVTRGEHGALVWSRDGSQVEAPVLSTSVVDSVGAGDAFLSITSLCAQGGFDPELIAFVGNCMGALAVTIVGNRESVDPGGLYEVIRRLLED